MDGSGEDRARLELAIAGTRLGLWDWDMATGHQVINDRWAEIVGYRREELEPVTIDTWTRLVHPDDVDAGRQAIAENASGTTPFYEAEVRMRHRDGHWVWVHTRGRVVEQDASGAATRMVGTHEDITEKHAILEALQSSQRRFASMFAAHEAVMLLIDPGSGHIVDANAAAAAFYGYDEATLTSMRIQDLDLQDVVEERSAAEGTVLLSHRHSDGSARTVEVHSSSIAVDDRTLLFSIIHDVTDREAYAQRLREASTVFDSALEGMLLVSIDGLITAANPSFTALTEWTADEVVGRPLSFLDAPVALPLAEHSIEQAMTQDEAYRGEHRFWCADGTFRDVQLSLNAVRGASGEPTGWVAQVSDLGERIRAEQARLDSLMHYDQSTGLPNRHLFLNRLGLEITALRRSQRSSALLLLNLDNFKAVNEAFGFEAGESLISHVAGRLQGTLGAGDVLARHAGDEFAVMLGGIGTRAQADTMARRVLASLDAMIDVPGIGELYVTACAGVVLLPEGIASADEAMHRATVALHAAKAMGPGTLQHHAEDFVPHSRERLVRVAQIRQGWLDGEFRLAYQPTWDVRTNRLIGAESLMRWHSPVLGEIPPAQFIPLAEDVGLIADLDAWAIHEACRQGAQWSREGLTDFHISVNVTAQQLVSEGFVEVVASALEENDFPARNLILELTESTLLHAARDTLAILNSLGELGVRIAIDDFGTGYSSFAYLRAYPLDKLKIDRSFIDGMEHDPSARSIVAAIIDVGHHLGLRVVAEGVETPEQLEILQDLGCDLYQGFLRSPAISPEALLETALSS